MATHCHKSPWILPFDLKTSLPFFEMRLNVTVAPEILEGVLGHRLAADLEELGILWRPGEIRSIFFS